jgi:2Fe-2S ferredoxin
MPTITVLPSGSTVEAFAEDTVFFSLLVGGMPLRTECNAQAKCNECHILVHEGLESLSKIAGPESDRLKMIASAGPKSRLACQAIMGSGDVTIEVVNASPKA